VEPACGIHSSRGATDRESGKFIREIYPIHAPDASEGTRGSFAVNELHSTSGASRDILSVKLSREEVFDMGIGTSNLAAIGATTAAALMVGGAWVSMQPHANAYDTVRTVAQGQILDLVQEAVNERHEAAASTSEDILLVQHIALL
jgi:hypothetical protein